MHAARRFFIAVLALCLAVACSGCLSVGESLYSLPRLPEEYVRLQALLDAELARGSCYCAPIGGSWQQSVQQVDLDGDGSQEALAFFTGGDGTPIICVYKADDEKEWSELAVITGEGSAIGSVDYADLDGNGTVELIAAWQTAAQLRLLTVYTLTQDGPAVLLTADCVRFVLTDLDGDGVSELMDLRIDSVDMYTFPAGKPALSDAALQKGVSRLERARMGRLSDGQNAFFVESTLADGRCATDVYCLRDGALTRLTMDNQARVCDFWAQDIDGDRCLEIPESDGPVKLGCCALRWYALDSRGVRSLKLTTLHCRSDGWYLTLTEAMARGLTFSRDDSTPGQRRLTLLKTDGDGEEKALAVILALFGDDRRELLEESGAFALQENGGVIYAALILDDAVTREELTESFHLIYSEWQTGVL